MGRPNSGDDLRVNLSTLNSGLMKCGRTKCKVAEGTRKDFNIVLTSGLIASNPIDPTLQDNVVIPTKFKHGKTDGILYSLESHDQGTQRSAGA